MERADRSHLYLFSGPAGTGKTTMARIMARALGCLTPMEIDGPSYSGVDDMRELRDYVQYQGLDGRPKVVIIDECHTLSDKAWQAGLKVMEEPPAHVYFMLATTEYKKVPVAIRTRAFDVTLNHIPMETLLSYGETVIAKERLEIPDGGIRYIAAQADGSLRQLLVDLNRVNGATSLKEVQQIMQSPIEGDDTNPFIQIARGIASGRMGFEQARKLLAKARENMQAEAGRIAIVEYFTAVVLNSEEPPRESLYAWLNAFALPVPDRGGWAVLLCTLKEGLGK